MDDFPSNAHADKEAKTAPAKPKHAPVVKGTATKRRIPLSRRLRQNFSGGEGIRGIWGHVMGEVLIPAAKDAAYDALRTGGERAIFGDTIRRPISRGGSQTSYTGYYKPAIGNNSPAQQQRAQTRDISPQARSRHDFGEIILDSRAEAETVIDTMFELLQQFEQVTVADLYELCNTSSAYTDQKYGWTTLQGANVQPVRGGGYLLNLPKPIALSN